MATLHMHTVSHNDNKNLFQYYEIWSLYREKISQHEILLYIIMTKFLYCENHYYENMSQYHERVSHNERYFQYTILWDSTRKFLIMIRYLVIITRKFIIIMRNPYTVKIMIIGVHLHFLLQKFTFNLMWLSVSLNLWNLLAIEKIFSIVFFFQFLFI